MNILSQTTETDGAQWVAVVSIKGVIYVASYVNSTLSVRLGPYKNNPRRPRWLEGAVRDWAEKQVAALSPEWMKLHRELYAS
jgi:hypothetical protein